MGTAPCLPQERLPFEGQTTYGAEFVPHQVEREPMPAYHPARAALPFEGTSTYQAEFVPKQPEAPVPLAPGGPQRVCHRRCLLLLLLTPAAGCVACVKSRTHGRTKLPSLPEEESKWVIIPDTRGAQVSVP